MKAKDLKNSILQMAVQGKLVPQDPADEPASVLLERIREERAKLIKEKKIKAPKGGESIIYRASDGSHYEKRGKGEPEPIEVPFDIPDSWEWARLEDIGDWKAGATPSKTNSAYHTNGNIPWLLTGDLNDSVVTKIPNKITNLALKECSVRLNPIGSVLIAMYGATIGKIGVLGIPATTNQACCACILHDESICQWLVTYLLYCKSYFTKLGEGGAQPNISREKIVNTYIPIPPLAEQQRIAERVAELMPLVEEYGKLEDEREALDASLPDRLRKSVLELAVEGKLAVQDLSEEPASTLLERIREERRKLVAEGKAKAPKGGESIIYVGSDGRHYEKRGKADLVDIENEIPFDIPKTWEWVRLETLAAIINGDRGKNYPAKSKLKDQGIPFVSALNIENGTVVSDQMKYLNDAQYTALRAGKLIKDDIVFCIRGSLGKYGVFPFEKGAIASSLVIVRPYSSNEISHSYLRLLFESPITRQQIKALDNGTAQPNLAAKSFMSFLYPIPPVTEQKRIIETIQELNFA